MTTYAPRPGSRTVTSQRDADLVGRELEKFGDEVCPEDVLEKAKRKRHPLHRFFTWDDTEAAYQHRLQQARQLINAVVIIHEEPEREPIEVKAFVPASRKDGGYRPVAKVMSDTDLRAEYLERAYADLKAAKRRWSHLSEFAKVWKAIPDTVPKVR